MPAIIANGLVKKYKTVTALKNLNFTIDEGEMFGFIGPDGAGKTSLFRILTSLLFPDEGTASVSGYDTVRDYKYIRKIAGYMPGRFSLYPDLTVQENLQFFASIFDSDIHQNYHLIRDIYSQIEPFKNRRAGKLSGGMKQKLALSCALIHKPEILFMDEPTTGVDPVSRHEFWEMLARLQAEGLTIVVSTPYMDEAARCDRIAMLYNGEILAIDSPEKVKLLHRSQLYSASGANSYSILRILRQIPFAENVYPFGQEVHFTLTEESHLENLKKSLDKFNPDIRIKHIPAGIEDVFLQLSSQKQNAAL